MLEIMKDKMEEDCEKWKKEIEESANKETTVDFMYIFNRIFGRLIIHICFGEDISNIMLDIWAREPGKDETILEKKKLTIYNATSTTFDQIMRNPV